MEDIFLVINAYLLEIVAMIHPAFMLTNNRNFLLAILSSFKTVVA
jgi:hypothetical protein